MIGLLALLFFVLWGFVAYKISTFLTKKIKTENSRKIAIPILSALIFFVPVTDEIIGGVQFRALCEGEYIKIAEGDHNKGKKVIYVGENEPLYDYVLPILKHHFSYKDIDTNEVIISWNIYDSEGGWLSRTLNILSSSKPYTFDGHCAPKNFWETFKSLNLNEIEKE